MAYTRNIYPNAVDSHQTSPAYVLTFLRWDNRDTYNYEGEDPLKLRKPFVVYSDAISISTNETKSSPQGTCNIVLKNGDINYATAVCPGDYFLLNIVNWETSAEAIRQRVQDNKNINGYNHGFKGLFKIKTVNKTVQVNPDGVKEYTTTVSGQSFTEMSNIVYYNHALANSFREAGAGLYQLLIGDFYQSRLAERYQIQQVLPDLFEILVGRIKQSKSKFPSYGSTQFKVPSAFKTLLGKSDIEYASDLYNFVVGIWGPSSGNKDTPPSKGFTSSFGQKAGGFYPGISDLEGQARVSIENWNKQTAWSILKSMSNELLNEMYTTHRVDDKGNVYPTLIIRQKPFNTPHFQAPTNFVVTRFFDLPRWKISPNLLTSFSISKSDDLRFNFVQVFSGYKDPANAGGFDAQIANKNFISDQGDITRNGLKPYIVTSYFDLPIDANKKTGDKDFRSPQWTQIVSDWVIDGHLKENGSFNFKGIQEPIAVGDNFEFDGLVYHIEGVAHNIRVNRDGTKTFDTKLTVSYGMDLRSSKTIPVYPQMEHTDYYTEQKKDWDRNRILPGVSDEQNIAGRKGGVEVSNTKEESFTGAPKKYVERPPEEPNDGSNKVSTKDDEVVIPYRK